MVWTLLTSVGGKIVIQHIICELMQSIQSRIEFK